MATQFKLADDDRNIFKELIKNNKGILIVKFTATWCGPCKRINTWIQHYLSEFSSDVKYLEVDLDDFGDVASSCKIKTIPETRCYVNSDLMHTFIGSSREDLVNFFTKVSKEYAKTKCFC